MFLELYMPDNGLFVISRNEPLQLIVWDRDGTALDDAISTIFQSMKWQWTYGPILFGVQNLFVLVRIS